MTSYEKTELLTLAEGELAMAVRAFVRALGERRGREVAQALMAEQFACLGRPRRQAEPTESVIVIAE